MFILAVQMAKIIIFKIVSMVMRLIVSAVVTVPVICLLAPWMFTIISTDDPSERQKASAKLLEDSLNLKADQLVDENLPRELLINISPE